MADDIPWLADILKALPDRLVDRATVEHLVREAWRAGIVRGKADLLHESFVMELKSIQLHPGDLLVMRLPRDMRLTIPAGDRLVEQIRGVTESVCNDVRCIILEEGIALEQVPQGTRP